VKEVTKLYGIKDIFLVSESNSTFQEAQNYPEFNWITNGAPPPIPANVGIEQALLGKKSTGKEVGERWYLEMMLMAESHAMIGTLTKQEIKKNDNRKSSLTASIYQIYYYWQFKALILLTQENSQATSFVQLWSLTSVQHIA